MPVSARPRRQSPPRTPRPLAPNTLRFSAITGRMPADPDRTCSGRARMRFVGPGSNPGWPTPASNSKPGRKPGFLLDDAPGSNPARHARGIEPGCYAARLEPCIQRDPHGEAFEPTHSPGAAPRLPDRLRAAFRHARAGVRHARGAPARLSQHRHDAVAPVFESPCYG